MSHEFVILTGNSNPKLAQAVCGYLGVPLGQVLANRFSDREIQLEIQENVRNLEVYVLQSTQMPHSNLFELLIFLDALKRSSAKKIIAVTPYLCYARQDRKVAPRAPITAKLTADLITAAGGQKIITLDLHAGQIQGFFNGPVDHLFARPAFLKDIIEKFYGDDLVIVSPDAGGMKTARSYATRLGVDVAMIDKRRPRPGQAEAMNIVGDVAGKKAIIIDDMVDSCGTLTEAVKALYGRGAEKVYAYATHPILSGQALERIHNSDLKSLVVSDSIPLKPEAEAAQKVRVVSVAPLLGEAIIRSHRGESVTSLFEDP